MVRGGRKPPQNGSRRFARALRIAGFPVEAFQMIGRDSSVDPRTGWQGDFKGITFDLGCYWAKNRQVRFLIIGLWTQDQRSASA